MKDTRDKINRWMTEWEKVCKRKKGLIYILKDMYVNIKISKEKLPKPTANIMFTVKC